MKAKAEFILETLERVAERAGDPKDRIYTMLFERHPDFEALFVMDVDGGVRANMLRTSIDCMIGVAEGRETPRFLLEAARMIHDGYGLSEAEVHSFFEVMRDVFREVLAADWTPAHESAWTALLAELRSAGQG